MSVTLQIVPPPLLLPLPAFPPLVFAGPPWSGSAAFLINGCGWLPVACMSGGCGVCMRLRGLHAWLRSHRQPQFCSSYSGSSLQWISEVANIVCCCCWLVPGCLSLGIYENVVLFPSLAAPCFRRWASVAVSVVSHCAIGQTRPQPGSNALDCAASSEPVATLVSVAKHYLNYYKTLERYHYLL